MAGKFLGFMVSQRGIEANPDKIWAIMKMASPRNVKKVQSLNGKIAALNRFVSRATDKCLPLFCTLKRSFEWTAECQQAFEELKAYLSSPPLLSPSQPGEEIFLYLAVSLAAVSVALKEERVQKPIYYASWALRHAKERYPPMEKFAFALVTAACKLKPYFQAYTVNVLTDKPLRQAIGNPEATGRLALWAIEFSKFDIQYRPQTAIKGQVVTNFIAEFTHDEDKGVEESPHWSIHIDRSSNRQVRGAGIILSSPEGDTVECIVRLDFPTTNNEAEYEALVAGLDLVKVTGAASIVIYCDSQVVANQVNGDYECKSERMKRYLDRVRKRVDDLEAKIIQIPRGENEQANRLAKAVSVEHMITPGNVLSFVQLSPLIDFGNIQEIGSESNWTTTLVSYLKNGVLLDGKEAIRKLKVQATRFVLIKDVLYKRGFSRPYLRCLGMKEADYVMKEVHEGICGNHSGSRSLVHKLVRAGYYWPTMQKDAEAYVKTCDKCQMFNNITRQPTEKLTSMTAPWPFAQWGLDIMGPFPTALRQLKFLVVGIDYFTKWVEAEALATITEKNVWSFNWKCIVCRFGIPRVLVLDNGKHFNNDSFRDFCSQTMARTPTGETPFQLIYESEAVIPAEVGLTSYRIHNHDESKNDEAMRLQLDLVDEVRATAEQRLARYQNRMAKHYNSRV
ncbi:uncharacterized protein LOC115961687 [Quercus lobata]|uniref:uncharacterized protein LOC115961687 n=1 Tax=Quercus lobata TaxID=97700 RepID=UPI001246DB8A|nr:uncharacterized protein LOC115961687 [Quercus lobata]